MSPTLRLAQGGGDRLAECVEVFRGSAIWERYFAGRPAGPAVVRHYR